MVEKKEKDSGQEISAPAPVEKDEDIYIFKSSGKHDGQEFKKGQTARVKSPQLLKAWLEHGVVCTKKEYDKLMFEKKSFRNKK